MPSTPSDLSRQAIEISNQLTRSHREHFGRGAGNVKTVIQKGFVVTFLEDIYTTLERTLIDTGRCCRKHQSGLHQQGFAGFTLARKDQHGDMFSTLSSTAQAGTVTMTHDFGLAPKLFDLVTKTLTVGLRWVSERGLG